MADLASVGDNRSGVAFLVSSGIVFEIIAFACSSPQTAELNIKTRGETLMKWVHMGEALGAGFVVAAAFVEPSKRVPILLGGGLAIAASEAYYRHAARSGMAKPGKPTERPYG